MPNSPHVLIVAGDPSGDHHGAVLAQTLKQRNPGLKVSSLGGSQLRRVADTFLYPLVGLGGFGFWEPFLKLPALWKAWRQVKQHIVQHRPDMVIPIDYYGFNIHVARLARHYKIPVVYYISPQVWASRPQRIRELAKVLNKMLVIFPFEVPLYRHAGIPVEFVGHPLLDQLPAPVSANGQLTIGLLPGSRRKIAERHLPIMVQTAEALRRTLPQANFVLFRPEELAESFYQPYLTQTPWLRVIQDPQYEQRKKLSLAITVSGTAALENMLLGIPMIVMYKLSPLTYAIARRLIRVPYVAIPNLLAGKALIPELLQNEATPAKLTAAARALLENTPVYRNMREELLSLRAQLGDPGSTQRAAQAIEQFLVKPA